MEKYAVYGELLYLGYVYEKGRCPSGGFCKCGYKKRLYTHMILLKNIILCMLNADVTKSDMQMIKQFAVFIVEEDEIGKYYPVSKEVKELFSARDYMIISSVNESKNFE